MHRDGSQGDGAARDALILEELVHDHRGDLDLHLCTAHLAVFNTVFNSVFNSVFNGGQVGVVSREAPPCRSVF